MASIFDAAMTRGLLNIDKKLKTFEYPKHSFFSKYLFGLEGITTSDDTYTWKYDIVKNKLIKDTRRGDNATVQNRDFNYKYVKYTFPYYFVEDSVNRDDRKVLLPQEDPANPFTENQRMLYKMKRKTDAIRGDMDLAVEKQCSDVLLTGKIVPYVGEYGNIEYLRAGDADFPVSSNIYSEEAANYWDATGISIYDRISAHVHQYWTRRGIKPDTLIVSLEVAELIMNDEKILKLLDNRRVNIGSIKPIEIDDEGMGEVCNILVGGTTLRVLSYAGFYFDENGTQTKYLPDNKAILTRRNIGSINYGGLEGISPDGMAISVAGKERIEVNKTTKTPVRYSVSVQRAPLVVPDILDGWATIQVLA